MAWTWQKDKGICKALYVYQFECGKSSFGENVCLSPQTQRGPQLAWQTFGAMRIVTQ